MNKKILSLIIILCTIISVFIIRHTPKIDINNNFISNRIKVFYYNHHKQKDDEGNKMRKYSYLFTDTSFLKMGDDFKKGKLDELGQKLESDKKEFFKENTKNINIANLSDVSDLSANQLSNNNESSKSISHSKVQQKLTNIDKEKLLAISDKLSAIDYEKARKLINSSKISDNIEAVKLLKQRLSDSDYEEIKNIYEKLNM